VVGRETLGITSERELPAFATETFREWWMKRGGNATSKKRAQKARVARDSESPSDRASGQSAREQTERGGAQVQNDEKRIAYFHGCYANYNTPEVAKALVRVYEHFGYEIMVPDQHCSGTPMFANGMLEDARRSAETNVRGTRRGARGRRGRRRLLQFVFDVDPAGVPRTVRLRGN